MSEAIVWRKNGDHPLDGGSHKEGSIVRYYRHPLYNGQEPCTHCGVKLHDHGWVDQGPHGNIVCPGSIVSVMPVEGKFIVKLPPIEAITQT